MKEWALIALVAVSRIGVGLVVWLRSGESAFWTPDSGLYVESARSLLHGAFTTSGRPEFFRTPGYPLILIPAVSSGHVVLVGIVENVILAVFVGWLLVGISELLFPGTTAARWAVILYCFEPLGFHFSEGLWSETAFTVAILLFVWLLLKFIYTPRLLILLLSALALAGATYIRPASLYLGPCVAVLLTLVQRRIKWAATFVAVSGLLLAPWILRNAIVADYTGFSSAGDWNLYFFSSAAIKAKLEHRDLVEVSNSLGANNDTVYFRNHPERMSWTRGRIAATWGSEGRETVREHWLMYLPIHLKGCAIVMFDPGVTYVLKMFHAYPEDGGLMSRTQSAGFGAAISWLVRQYPAAALLLPLLTLQMMTYYLLAAIGLRRMDTKAAWLLLTIAAYLILISGMPSATGRYRVPLMPLVCIAASLAVARNNIMPMRAASGSP